jgi:hypothetical protein
MLFPPIQVRFAIALLFTFFPYGLLYPLDYPGTELLTLCAWVWVFPSPLGCLSLGLLPLIPDGTYGYFAFNLFCLLATVGTAWPAMHCREFSIGTIVQLHKFARSCILLVLAICLLQVITGPDIWVSMFPRMSLGGGGRAAGLRLEPSLLAGPLSLYLALLVGRIGTAHALREPLMIRKSLVRNGIWVALAFLILTRSISMLTIVACFLPALLGRRRSLLLPTLALGSGIVVAVFALGDRIEQAIGDASGSIADLMTVSVGSWRNIPDLLIVSNYRAFLMPGNPAEVRAKINMFAVLMNPGLAWIQNTYSTFAAGAATAGLLVVGLLFIGGLVAGLKLLSKSTPMRLTWVMLYFCGWLLTPKYEAAGWIVLGLLPLTHQAINSAPEPAVECSTKASEPISLTV